MKYSIIWIGFDNFKFLINDFYDKSKEVFSKALNNSHSETKENP